MTNTERNLQVSLNWAEVGASIFVTGPGKKPRVRWRDQSTRDPGTIKDWFNQWPDSLPAIDLAKSGIVVIDGDRHGGPDGVAAAEQIFAQHKLNAAAIPTVITPRDGRHYWFRQPTDGKPLGNGDRAVRDSGINVRGHGGSLFAAFGYISPPQGAPASLADAKTLPLTSCASRTFTRCCGSA
jgi:hypothetical protein